MRIGHAVVTALLLAAMLALVPAAALAQAATPTAAEALPPDAFAPPPQDFSLCEEADRGPMCAQVYQPVCALIDTGAWTTYPNACTACAEGAVVGWQAEECPER